MCETEWGIKIKRRKKNYWLHRWNKWRNLETSLTQTQLKNTWKHFQEEGVIKTHLDENINAFIPFQNMLMHQIKQPKLIFTRFYMEKQIVLNWKKKEKKTNCFWRKNKFQEKKVSHIKKKRFSHTLLHIYHNPIAWFHTWWIKVLSWKKKKKKSAEIMSPVYTFKISLKLIFFTHFTFFFLTSFHR